MNTGSRREAVQIEHAASSDASQLNVNAGSAGDVLSGGNIFKSFGENEVLKGISLAAKKHEVISILGSSSGCGMCARSEGEQLFGTAARASAIGWHAAMYGEECVADGPLSSRNFEKLTTAISGKD